ncbi:MAG: DNA replication/repair protein RecF [Bacteroidota bacterium]
MYLKNLHLLNFKNYISLDIEFDDGINCFVGNNGEGKTNLLDAIYYLSMCKSYFNYSDTQNIKQGEQFFLVKGSFDKGNSEEEIYCGFKIKEGKVFKRNQKEYARLAEHIGLFPCVIISPTDINLVWQGSEDRRKLIDAIISQFDPTYLDNLINYNKVLAQRNALLKKFASNRYFSESELEVWDDMMEALGTKIHSVRKEFLNLFVPTFNNYYQLLSDGKEQVGLDYESNLNDLDFKQALKASVEKDRVLQYTSVGIHKDDLTFTINDFPLKKHGSQGQQKSFLIALKLAQFEYIKNKKGIKPLLLLDDIFDKLDQGRVERLMTLVSDDAFGQIFVTDTHPERIKAIFDEINVAVKTFLVKEGNVQPLN